MFTIPPGSYSERAADYFRTLYGKDLNLVSMSFGKSFSRILVSSIVASVALAVLATIDIGVYCGKAILSAVPFVQVQRPPLIHLAGLVELLVLKAPLVLLVNYFGLMYGYFPATESSNKAEANRKQAEVKAEADRKQVEADRKQAAVKAEADRKQAEEARNKARLELVAVLSEIHHSTMDPIIAAIQSKGCKLDLFPLVELIRKHAGANPSKKLIDLICSAFVQTKGLDVWQQDVLGQTILDRAISCYSCSGSGSGKEQAYKRIIFQLLDLGFQDCNYLKSYVHPLTACMDDLELLIRLLKAGVSPNRKTSSGDFPLLAAAESFSVTSLAAMALLICYGADPKMEKLCDYSPLFTLLGMQPVQRDDNWTDKVALLRGLQQEATVDDLRAAAAVFSRLGYCPISLLYFFNEKNRPELTPAKTAFLLDLCARFDHLPRGEEHTKLREAEMITDPQSAHLEEDSKERRADPSETDKKLAFEEWAPADIWSLCYSYVGSMSEWIEMTRFFDPTNTSPNQWKQIELSANSHLEFLFINEDFSKNLTRSPIPELFNRIYRKVYQ